MLDIIGKFEYEVIKVFGVF